MSSPYVVWRQSPKITLARGALLCALAAAGCSDDAHSLGGEAPLVGTCASGAAIEPIDFMEDDDGTIERIGERAGTWFWFNDETSTQWPAHEDGTIPMVKLRPARSGSHYAARARGKGFSDWGAGIGLELYSHQAYDLSGYAGITFWARSAPDMPGNVRLALPDSATSPRGRQCREKCNQHFGSDLSLDTVFRRYSFRWDELTPDDWGGESVGSLRASQVYNITFQVKTADDFDFWIDDVALLCNAN